MKDIVEHSFKKRFGAVLETTVKAPGRINLIGEHIDYNHGFVMPAAIDKGICFGLSFSMRKFSELFAIDRNESYLSNAEKNPDWSNYIRAVVSVLKGRNLNTQKFTGVFTSNLPIGAGLSSSAALCAGFVFALDQLHQWKLTRLEMALIAQEAEHKVGIKCGLMDQFAVLHGKIKQVIKMDCLDNSHEYIPADLGDYQLVLINSKVAHSLMETAYNDRRQNCETAFEILKQQYPQAKSYRDISLDNFEKASSLLTEDQSNCVKFVIEEIQRVKAATKALSNNDIPRLGVLLNETQDGLSRLYKVTCEETDLLAQLAQQEKAVAGARQMGGGFGGCVIVLLEQKNATTVANAIAESYQQKTGIEPEIIFVAIGNGVEVV